MKNLIILLMGFFLQPSQTQAHWHESKLSIDPTKAIKLVLIQQEEAWNKGDLDGFMSHYWNNENLQFVSKNGIKKGWQSVYNSYQKNYVAKGEMGKLSFEVLSINPIDKQNALVNGSWKVVNHTGTHQGYFTLWFRKIEGKWLIVMDHTS